MLQFGITHFMSTKIFSETVKRYRLKEERFMTNRGAGAVNNNQYGGVKTENNVILVYKKSHQRS